jgi:molybdopterin converting factor small subunit
MKVMVLGFGIVREIFGNSGIEVDLPEEPTIADLRCRLEQMYPSLRALASYMVATNDRYAKPDDRIHPGLEIAVIPPVSGG